MERLYLLRHGIALPHGTPEVPDDERPLTPKGERRLRQVGRGLRRLGLKLDRIVTSPLPRARQTAEIVAEELGVVDLLEDADALRADRDASLIRDWVLNRSEAKLMLVGHNPSLTDLVGLLIGSPHGVPPCELRKGGIAALRPSPSAGMQLHWLAPPRLFRRLS